MNARFRRIAVAAFGAVLQLYPAEFRREFRDAAIAGFRRRLQLASSRGGARATLRTALVDLGAAVGGAVSERAGAPRRARLPHVPERSDILMTAFVQDLRLAVRGLRRAPGFALAAVTTLALGIGMNTAIFSVIQAVLLRPLPYDEPGQLVAPNVSFQGQRWWSAALADVLEWRELANALESVAFGTTSSLAVSADAEPQQVPGVRVSANWFDTLGVDALLGRGFVAGEDSPASDHAAVVSYGYWTQQMGADPTALGTTLRIDGNETTIVGVLPEDYRADFWGNPQIYITRRFTIEDAAERVRFYMPVARLRDGVGRDAAQADLDRVARMVAERSPDAMEGWTVDLLPLHDAVTARQRPLLGLLLGAVGLVLLVACANVSNLMLARGTRQGRELAVRTALGATRTRLVRQMLTETVVLALVGGGLGLALAAWVTSALLAQAPRNIPRIDEAGIDPAVLMFTLAVSLLTGLLFGLLPALRGSRANVSGAFRDDDGRTTAGTGVLSGRNLLVAAELALVVALLVAAGVTLRGFQTLRNVELGFDPGGKLVVPVTLPTDFSYDEIDRIARFFEQVREGIAAAPGVVGVADVSIPPLFGGTGQTGYHIIEGRDYDLGAEPTGGTEMVSPEYFDLMGMELIEGRGLSELDRRDSAPVAVINDAMARLYWSDASPIGSRVRIGKPDGGPLVARWLEIVGVVRGIRYGPEQEVRPRLYMSDAQSPAPMNFRAVIVTARGGDPLELVESVRAAVAAIDPNQPIGVPRRFADLADGSLSTRRLQSLLIALFGVVALVLGAVGVYGVVSYAVTERRQEMGIRLALGAGTRDVRRLVLRQAMAPVLAGVAIGLAAAAGLSGVLASLLPHTRGIDELTLVTVPAILLVTALLASWLPARRATRVDPVASLRAR